MVSASRQAVSSIKSDRLRPSACAARSINDFWAGLTRRLIFPPRFLVDFVFASATVILPAALVRTLAIHLRAHDVHTLLRIGSALNQVLSRRVGNLANDYLPTSITIPFALERSPMYL